MPPDLMLSHHLQRLLSSHARSTHLRMLKSPPLSSCTPPYRPTHLPFQTTSLLSPTNISSIAPSRMVLSCSSTLRGSSPPFHRSASSPSSSSSSAPSATAGTSARYSTTAKLLLSVALSFLSSVTKQTACSAPASISRSAKDSQALAATATPASPTYSRFTPNAACTAGPHATAHAVLAFQAAALRSVAHLTSPSHSTTTFTSEAAARTAPHSTRPV